MTSLRNFTLASSEMILGMAGPSNSEYRDGRTRAVERRCENSSSSLSSFSSEGFPSLCRVVMMPF
jgi:hypothetical protein